LSHTGYLFINLGTPDSPEVADVRQYLQEFLMDPYVLDVPGPIRRLIVSGFILPFRPKKSAEAYAAIWDVQGSPLLLYSEALVKAMDEALQGPVALAMRYGSPSIADGIRALADADVQRIIAIPLYPQYADSTVTTSVEEIQRLTPAHIETFIVPAFYDDADYIAALSSVVKAALPEQWDHMLMSYHGLPERHLRKADPTGSHCMSNTDCCRQPSPAHATCYRHQVFRTSQALAAALGIRDEQYTVSFQSRLGGGWMQPYTDKVLEQLPGQGVRRLAVVCPAFVADNLETLEEMGIQGRETFLGAGGEQFDLIPCLNDAEVWIQALTNIIGNFEAEACGTASQTSAASTFTSE